MIKTNGKLYFLFMVFMFGLVSCVNDEMNKTANEGPKKTLSLKISTPPTTRSQAHELKIVKENLSIFLFSVNEQSLIPETLLLVSDDKNLTFTPPTSGSDKFSINLKIPAKFKQKLYGVIVMSENSNDYTTTEGMTYQKFESTLVLRQDKRLDYTQPTPLTGHFNVDANSDKLNTEAFLTRIFARAKFAILDLDKQVDSKGNPAKYQFDNIESVRIYRSVNMYSMLPFLDAKKGQASMPKEAQYLVEGTDTSITNSDVVAQNHPVVYLATDMDKQNKLMGNQVLLAEKKNNANGLRNEVITAVVGVKLNSTEFTGERFYRIDFAEYDGMKPVNFKDIMRNTIYKFDLGGAESPGGATPEEALTEESVLHVGFQDWNEYKIDSDELNGQYYFNLKSGNLEIKHTASERLEVKYETNIYPGIVDEDLKLRWSDDEGMLSESKLFNIELKAKDNTLVITPKTSNETKCDKYEFLELNLYKQNFKIKVTQRNKPADYQLKQKSAVVNGVYMNGMDLTNTAENTIDVTLIASDLDKVKNLTYHIKTEIVDGIYVDEKGEFGADGFIEKEGMIQKTVTLKVKGKSTSPKDKSLILEADGVTPSFLKVHIPFAKVAKKVQGYFNGSNSLKSNTNFLKLIDCSDQSVNFGHSKNATVQIENITYLPEKSGKITLADLQATMPDVVIIGKAFDESEANAIYEYAQDTRLAVGGRPAIIIMNGDQSITPILSKNKALKSIGNAQRYIPLEIGPNFIESSRPQPIQFREIGSKIIEDKRGRKSLADFLTPSTLGHFRYFFPLYDWDLVSNGSFGRLGTEYIQLNKTGYGIRGLEYHKAVKYTGIVPYALDAKGAATNRPEKDIAYSMFRLTELPILWIGDKDFVTSDAQWEFKANGAIAQHVRDITYYALNNESGNDSFYVPMMMAYNGFAFASILEWAFYTSEYGLN